MIRQLLNRVARKSAADATPVEDEESQRRALFAEAASKFTAAFHELDDHAAARQELALAGVASQQIESLYGSAFTTALNNLVPLVLKEDLLRVLISNVKRQQVVNSTNKLLRDVLGPSVSTSGWLANQPVPGGSGLTAQSEEQIDALLGPAYAGHGIGYWFVSVLWNAWWLGELRSQMNGAQRQASDLEICGVVTYLVPRLTLRPDVEH